MSLSADFSQTETLMIIRTVIPCLAVIAIGYLVGRYDEAKNEKTISSLIYFVFTPALVFSAFHKHAFGLAEAAVIGGAAVLLVAALLPAAFYIRRRAGTSDNHYLLAIPFMSSGSVLLPLALLLFGHEGLAKAVLFHLFSLFLFYSAGAWLAEGRPQPGRFFKMPAFIAAVIGLASARLSIQVPDAFIDFFILCEKGIDIIALGALPLLLLGFGYPLSNLKRGDLSRGIAGALTRVLGGLLVGLVLVYCFRKLAILPMEKGYDVLSYIDIRTTEAVILLTSAMPGSLSVYHANKIRGAYVIETLAMLGVGAIAAIVTIPAVLYLISSFLLGH